MPADAEFNGVQLSALSNRAEEAGLEEGAPWPSPCAQIEGVVIAITESFRDLSGESFRRGYWYQCARMYDSEFTWIGRLGPASAHSREIDFQRHKAVTTLSLPAQPKRDMNSKWAKPLRDAKLAEVAVEVIHHVGGDSLSEWPYGKIRAVAPPGLAPQEAVAEVLRILEQIKPDLHEAILLNIARREIEVLPSSLDLTQRVDGSPGQIGDVLKHMHARDLSLRDAVTMADLGHADERLKQQIKIVQIAKKLVAELSSSSPADLQTQVEQLQEALFDVNAHGGFAKILAGLSPGEREEVVSELVNTLLSSRTRWTEPLRDAGLTEVAVAVIRHVADGSRPEWPYEEIARIAPDHTPHDPDHTPHDAVAEVLETLSPHGDGGAPVETEDDPQALTLGDLIALADPLRLDEDFEHRIRILQAARRVVRHLRSVDSGELRAKTEELEDALKSKSKKKPVNAPNPSPDGQNEFSRVLSDFSAGDRKRIVLEVVGLLLDPSGEA